MRFCFLVQAEGPAKIGHRRGGLAGIHEHFAAEREPLDVVGIGRQEPRDFLSGGVGLVINLQAVQTL